MTKSPDGGEITSGRCWWGNKEDVEEAKERERFWLSFVYADFPVLHYLSRPGSNLESLRRALYNGLGVLRVTPSHPVKSPSNDTPFVLKQG